MFDQDFRVAGVVVRPSLNRVERHGQEIRLRPKSMEVLAFLAARPGRVATREEVLSAVWPGISVAEEGLTQCIADIREALGDNVRQPIYIETIPERGYRLIVRVEVIGNGEPPASGATTGPLPDARASRPDAVAVPDGTRCGCTGGGRAAGLLPLALGLLGIRYVFGTTALHDRRVRWAHETALPEIVQLVARDEWPAAFALARGG